MYSVRESDSLPRRKYIQEGVGTNRAEIGGGRGENIPKMGNSQCKAMSGAFQPSEDGGVAGRCGGKCEAEAPEFRMGGGGGEEDLVLCWGGVMVGKNRLVGEGLDNGLGWKIRGAHWTPSGGFEEDTGHWSLESGLRGWPEG